MIGQRQTQREIERGRDGERWRGVRVREIERERDYGESVT